jgi:hypothetical protein
MTLETVYLCPMTQAPRRCEYVEDNKIHRCGAYMTLAGVDPSTGEKVDDDRCVINWLPVLLIEGSSQQRSTAAAVESFRNEMVQNSAVTNLILHNAAQTRRLEDS